MSEVTECVGCEYWQPLNSPGGVKACHYCIITGNVRGIPAADCYKHEGTAYTPAGKGAREMKGKIFDEQTKNSGTAESEPGRAGERCGQAVATGLVED